MGSPSRNSLAIVDPVLSNFSLAFAQEGLVTKTGSGFGLTADFIFPMVPHVGQGMAGTYATYNLGNKFTLPAAALIKRASGGQYHPVDWDISSETYQMEDYGLSTTWDDKEVQASVGPVELNRDGTEVVAELNLLDYQRRVNAIVTDASVITQTAAASTLNGQWDTAGSNPIGDVNTAISTIYQATGKRPNRMVIGWDGWIDGIMNNDEIIGRLQAAQLMGGNADIRPQVVGQQLFGLDLRVDTGIVNSAVEGQTASLSTSATNMFGTNALIFYSTPRPSLRVRTLGTTIFQANEFMRVRRWNENPKMHVVAASMVSAEELVNASSAYLITAVTS